MGVYQVLDRISKKDRCKKETSWRGVKHNGVQNSFSFSINQAEFYTENQRRGREVTGDKKRKKSVPPHF